LADFGIDLRMYGRTQTQYKVYGSINTIRVSRETLPTSTVWAFGLSQAAVAPRGNEHRATDERLRIVTGKNVTAD